MERTKNVYVVVPESLMVINCAEAYPLVQGDTLDKGFIAASHNKKGIEDCRSILYGIYLYNEEAKKKGD